MTRPTKYTPELLEKAYHYCENWREYGELIPSHRTLASELEVARVTLYAWARDPKKEEFSYILERILMSQELELLNKGLSGEFNSAICKLLLGKHGYSDKKEAMYSGDLQVRPIVRTITDQKYQILTP